MRVDELIEAAGGDPVGRVDPSWRFQGLSTDSRTLEPGQVFVAIRGEHFDGNDFIDDALARGASVVVCARGRAKADDRALFVETGDTLRALGEIARAYRAQFEIPVVAITGSNGKTTTKDMLRAILDAHYGSTSVLATEGNLNNLIGLPLTLGRLRSHHRAAVVEMGMNARGEIARLTEIARPTVGVITCVGAAHLEGLGSLDGVAEAKGELYAGLGAGATAVVNADDERVVRVAQRFRGRRISFGRSGDVRATNVEPLAVDRTRFHLVCEAGSASVEMGFGGAHNVANALAATAAALAIGVDLKRIVEGLSRAAPPPMRLASERLENGVVLVNDAYNANPSSLRAALRALADLAPERVIIVLGEMRELGRRAAELHERAGADIAALRPVLLCASGAYARAVREGAVRGGLDANAAQAFDDHEEIARAVAGVWRRGDIVLVKGSRGARMERVADALKRLSES